MLKRNRNSLTALAAAGLLTTSFALGHLGVSKAQDTPPSAPRRPRPSEVARPAR